MVGDKPPWYQGLDVVVRWLGVGQVSTAEAWGVLMSFLLAVMVSGGKGGGMVVGGWGRRGVTGWCFWRVEGEGRGRWVRLWQKAGLWVASEAVDVGVVLLLRPAADEDDKHNKEHGSIVEH